jgi:putative phosphoribosyl transferase
MKAGGERQVRIASGSVSLEGVLEMPPAARAVVLFAHDSDGSRRRPRRNHVATQLRGEGLGTLVIDLLTAGEDRDRGSDIALLVERLHDTVRWLITEPATRGLRVGLFGSGSGSAAAVQLAAAVPSKVAAVVARGGRPDLAGRVSLARVKVPTLLIVGGDDREVLALNEAAFACLACPKLLFVVPGTTHLFEEAGALEAAAQHATDWFMRHLAPVHAQT